MITVNGRQIEGGAGCSLADMLESLGFDREKVAVEVNRELVRRQDFDHTILPTGAIIEVFSFVGGG